MSAVYLIPMLRDSPLLEEVEFVRLSLPVLAPTPPDPFVLPHLKTFSLVEMFHDSQDYILSRVKLPPQCELIIRGYAQRHNHHRLLHPSTVTLLAPIRFTSVSLYTLSVEYQESRIDSRCSLSMRICLPPGYPADVSMAVDPEESLDLSHVTTLHLYDVRDGVQRDQDVVFVLLSVARSLRTLVFHARAPNDLPGSWLGHLIILHNARLLETVILDEVNLASVNGARASIVDIIINFTTKRREQGVESPRVVLYRCKVDSEGLRYLRDATRVEIVD